MLTKYIRIAFYYLFFFAPLMMNSQTSEIFEFNKMLLIYFFTTVISGMWLISQIQSKTSLFRPRFLIIAGLFLISQILSTVFSIDFHTSFYGYYGRFNGGLLSIISYLTLFFVFLQVFDKESFLKLLKISFISSVVVIVWGMSGKIGFDLSCLVFTGELTNACWTNQFQPAVRMFSTIGQPNWLGAYLAILFFIGLFFYVKENKSALNKWMYTIYIIANFAALIFTRSRSALLALGVGILVWVSLVYFAKGWSYIKNVLHKSLPLIVGLTVFIVIFKTGVPAIDRYLNFGRDGATPSVQQPVDLEGNPIINSNVTDSFDIRKIVWDGAWKLGKQYPILGTGVETFAYAYYLTRPVEHNYTSEWDFIYNKAHNEYLNYLATTGFVGLFTYVLLIGAVFLLYINEIRKRDENSVLFISLLSAYVTILITNFFGFSTTTINLFFYLIPGFYFILTNNRVNSVSRQKLAPWKYGVITFIGLGTAILAWKVVTYYRADVLYASANRSLALEEYHNALSSLDDALNLRYEHVYEDKLSLVAANLAVVAAQQEEKDLSNKLIKLSQGYNGKALRASPQNVLYWKSRAKNDYLFYQINNNRQYVLQAIESLEIAKELAPTDPKLPYTQALFYSSLAQTDKKYQPKSLEEIDKSITLKKDYRDAHLLKGQLLLQYDEKERARQVFEYMLKTFDPQDIEVHEQLQLL